MRKSFIYLLLLFVAIGCHMEVPLSPVASFQMTPVSGCQAPCQVTFTSTSQHATSLEWDFDDGTKAKGADPQTHEFTYGKKFYVKLIAGSADGGSQGVTQIIEIKAVAASKPEADFSYTFEKADVLPAKALFSNKSKNGERYEWNFGDLQSSTSNSNTSTEQNPSHSYTKEGVYTVTLATYNIDGVSSTKPLSVTVKLKEPVAAFTVSGGGCTAPCKVTFTNSSVNADVFEWDFGDGAKSTDKSPEHQFDKAGTYTVKLTVSNAAGTKNTHSETVTVGQALNAIAIKGDFNFPSDIVSDAAGNIYVCGTIKGTNNFGDGWSYSSRSNSNDYFVAKYNSENKCLWAYIEGGVSSDYAGGLTLDNNNNVYVTGYVSDEAGIKRLFVDKIESSTGKRQWYKTIGGPSGAEGRDVAFFNTSYGPRIYLAGVVSGSFNFDGQFFVANGQDVFFAFINANTGDIIPSLKGPEFKFAPKVIGADGPQTVQSIVVDQEGNAYITGSFEQAISFPSPMKTMVTTGRNDVFVAKFSLKSEEFEWAKKAGSSGDDYGYDLAVDSDKNVYVTGTHQGAFIELGVGSKGDENVFLGKWNSSGELLKGRNGFNDGLSDYAGGVVITKQGNILVSGSYFRSGSFPFNASPSVQSNGSTDMIISEVEPKECLSTGNFQVSAGGIGEERAIKLCVTSDGYVYSTGWFSGNAVFNGSTLSSSSALPNTYIVKYKR